MNKFAEISVLATKYSKTIFENKTQCQGFAAQIVQGYADYLDCPIANVDFLRLDEHLRPTGDVVQFGGIVPVILGSHGLWHFCARIRFDGANHGTYAHELLKLSLNCQDGKLLVQEEREFCVDLLDPATMVPLFECLYGNSVEGFSNPLSKQHNRIGFIV